MTCNQKQAETAGKSWFPKAWKAFGGAVGLGSIGFGMQITISNGLLASEMPNE